MAHTIISILTIYLFGQSNALHISEELTESLVKGSINKNRFDIFWEQKHFNSFNITF